MTESEAAHAKTDFKEIEAKLRSSIEELFKRDSVLLERDVSERAITHKLAVYLQFHFPDLEVDCEYNRNSDAGRTAPKTLLFELDRIHDDLKRNVKGVDLEEQLLAVSSYPDIIVHKRLTNANNTLVIEIKKTTSRVEHAYDQIKLKAFTDQQGLNAYHYRYGAFIVFRAGEDGVKDPEVQWFIDGREFWPQA